ncbi:hypothetical protein RB195_022970 [Necator americanus]|uniref:Uncharacterized protein n=1 Tax=Necator americanus TaxID=51031 RepID=A0ABR1EHI0_NECAM
MVGIDANAKMGLEQHPYVLRRWCYSTEDTSDNGDRLVDLCEQTGLIIAPTFKRNHRRHQHTWQWSTLLTPEARLRSGKEHSSLTYSKIKSCLGNRV